MNEKSKVLVELENALEQNNVSLFFEIIKKTPLREFLPKSSKRKKNNGYGEY